MSPQLLEAVIVIVAGALAMAYGVTGGRFLQVACICGGIATVIVGIILAIHAGL